MTKEQIENMVENALCILSEEEIIEGGPGSGRYPSGSGKGKKTDNRSVGEKKAAFAKSWRAKAAKKDRENFKKKKENEAWKKIYPNWQG